MYLQTNGVCIGSRTAPVLSDLYLASQGRKVAGELEPLSVLKVLRYVDDFLVFMDGVGVYGGKSVAEVLGVFERCYHASKLTHEMPEETTLRFLHLRLSFSEDHVCWQYEPRSNKPLLPFSTLSW